MRGAPHRTAGYLGGSKKKGARPLPGKVCTSIVDGLKSVYFRMVRPGRPACMPCHVVEPSGSVGGVGLCHTPAPSLSPTRQAQACHPRVDWLDPSRPGCHGQAGVKTKRCACAAAFVWLQVRPLEEQYKFGHFFSPLLSEGDFEAKPSVLLLGQYSTGESRDSRAQRCAARLRVTPACPVLSQRLPCYGAAVDR